jgi:hypothetical protein
MPAKQNITLLALQQYAHSTAIDARALRVISAESDETVRQASYENRIAEGRAEVATKLEEDAAAAVTEYQESNKFDVLLGSALRGRNLYDSSGNYTYTVEDAVAAAEASHGDAWIKVYNSSTSVERESA